MLKKAVYLSFLIGMAQLPIATNAQLNKEKGGKHIVVNSPTIRVGDLLGIISRETDLEFSFNSKKLSPSKVIPVTHRDQTLSAWLTELEKTTGIHIKVKGDHIILQDVPLPLQRNAAIDRITVNAGLNSTPGKSLQPDTNKQNTSPAAEMKPATGKSKTADIGSAHDTAAIRKAVQDQAAATAGKRKAPPVLAGKTPAASNKSNTPYKEGQITAGNAGQQQDSVRGSLAVHAEAINEDVLSTSKHAAATAENSITQVESNSLSMAIATVLSKEELRFLPVHELPAPDKHINIVNSITPADVKAVTATGETSQQTDTGRTPAPPLQKLVNLDLGLQGIGISFELPVQRNLTIEFSGGFGGGYDLTTGSLSYDWDLTDPCVYLSVNPRYYYNRDKRQRKGKKSILNAGNYIGLRAKYTAVSLIQGTTSDAFLINLHWGMHKPIGRKWTINGHAGVGSAFNFTDIVAPVSWQIYPAAELKFSYTLNKKRNL